MFQTVYGDFAAMARWQLGHGVQALAGRLDTALFGQLFPDGEGKLFGGLDADDRRAAAAGERTRPMHDS